MIKNEMLICVDIKSNYRFHPEVYTSIWCWCHTTYSRSVLSPQKISSRYTLYDAIYIDAARVIYVTCMHVYRCTRWHGSLPPPQALSTADRGLSKDTTRRYNCVCAMPAMPIYIRTPIPADTTCVAFSDHPRIPHTADMTTYLE